MAIEQRRRENLLDEATAYRRRALFRFAAPIDSFQPPFESMDSRQPILREWLSAFHRSATWELFVGFRSDDGWSVYFDEQPVLQFTCENRLRRLFAGDRRYAAELAGLKLLDRQTLGGHVQFREVALEPAIEAPVVEACRWFLETAAHALESSTAQQLGIVPREDQSWLSGLPSRLRQTALGFGLADSARA